MTRVDGVGDTLVFGARDYSMRIWLDPAKIQARGLAAERCGRCAARRQRAVAAGAINQPPAKSPGGFQIAVQTLGRLSSPEQFSDIVVATDPDGRVTRVRDIAPGGARIAGLHEERLSRRQGRDRDRHFPAAGLECARDRQPRCSATMEELAKSFPPGLGYRVAYNTTEFIQQSVDEVIKTLVRSRRAGRDRHHPVPADLACRDHSDRRDPGFAGRHVFRHAGVRLFAEQSDAVRAGSRDRHRRGRRHRRRGERRALSARRA